jgi:hypothetical protein
VTREKARDGDDDARRTVRDGAVRAVRSVVDVDRVDGANAMRMRAREWRREAEKTRRRGGGDG